MRLLQEEDLFLTKKVLTNANTTIQDLSSTMTSIPKQQSQLNIDTFTFKIFCLLMCKGSNSTKSNILFDLVIGTEGLRQGKQDISWRSSRLVLAIKKILYFSDTFIQHYSNQYLPLHESVISKFSHIQGDQNNEKDISAQTLKVIYEHDFIDKIILDNESIISRTDFVSAVGGDAECWIFSPSKTR